MGDADSVNDVYPRGVCHAIGAVLIVGSALYVLWLGEIPPRAAVAFWIGIALIPTGYAFPRKRKVKHRAGDMPDA